MKGKSSICLVTFLLSAFLIKDAISIYSSNEGIKTKSYRHDPRFADPNFRPENQTIVMHHQYSQVISNRPGSQYVSQYNEQNSNNNDAITTSSTTTKQQTTSQHSYQGSNRVYHENTPHSTNDNRETTNNRLGRKSSRTYEIENQITPYKTECPPGATGQFPYALDCRRFLNCWKGHGHIQACAPGTIFNPDTLECDNPQKVVCHGVGGKYESNNEERFERLQEHPRTVFETSSNIDYNDDNVKCHPRTSGVEPHPYDCTKFLNCANGLTYIQKCGPGTVFNEKISACDHPQNVNCGTRKVYISVVSENHEHYREGKLGKLQESFSVPGTVEVTSTNGDENVKCSPGVTGLQPHPFDCTKFLNCAHGLTHIQSCGPGTGFNEASAVCDLLHQVNCGTRKVNLDLTSVANEHYEIRRPYNEQVLLSPSTQTHRVTTTYTNYPTSYGSSSTTQQQYGSYYSDHQHTKNCTHESHNQYTQTNSQNPNQNTNIIYTQYSGAPTKIIYPTRWIPSINYNPGRTSYTKNVTTIHSQTLENSQKPNVNVVYSNTNTNGDDDDDVQRPYSGSQFTIVYPERQDNGQHETQPLPNENDDDDGNQRLINPDWTSSGSETTTSTFYSQSHTRQPGYGRQYPSISYNPPPTTTTYYKPSGGGYNPSYQQKYNQSLWTSITTSTQQQNRPQTSYTNVNIEQANVHQIPKNNYDLLLEQLGLPKNISNTNTTNTQTNVYYAEPVDNNQYEENFENIAGGDIPAYPVINTQRKNKTSFYDSDEETETGQQIVPLDLEDYQNPINSNDDIITSESVYKGVPVAQKVPENSDNLYGGLLPPLSSSEVSSTPVLPIFNREIDNIDDNPSDNLDTQKVVTIPSINLLPPYTNEEWRQRTRSKTVTNINQKFENIPQGSVSTPPNYMLPPMTSEEEHQKNLPIVPVPPGYMLPPMTSSEERQKTSKPTLTPSRHISSPFAVTEEHHETHSSVVSNQRYKTTDELYSTDNGQENLPVTFFQPSIPKENYQINIPLVYVPPGYMLPPMTSEEEHQKNLPIVPVPPDYMLPPMTSSEERQKTLSSVPTPSRHISSPFAVTEEHHETHSSVSKKKYKSITNPYDTNNDQKSPSVELLPPMTSEEEYQKSLPSVSIPPDYMLPPITSSEERQKTLSSIPFPNEEDQETLNTASSKQKYKYVPSPTLAPSVNLLPPMTSEEERQKNLASISSSTPREEQLKSSTPTAPYEYDTRYPSIPVPADHMLPPMTLEEELRKAFNSTSKVVPIYGKNKPTSENIENPYPQYNPSYSSVVTHSGQPTTINMTRTRTTVTTSQRRYYTPEGEYYPSPSPPQSLNRELDAEQIFNDTVIVHSPTIRVTPPLQPSYYHSTTRQPPNTYTSYNRQYYKGSSSSSSPSSSPHSGSDDSTEAKVSSLPLSEALKILLRPYMNRSGTVTDEDVQKSQTHIMKVVKTSYEEKHEPTQKPQKQTKPTQQEQEQHENDEQKHEKDVELIFTGEQINLNQEESKRRPYDRQYHHPHHYNHHRHHFDHDSEFQANNPNLPGPFESQSDNLESGYYRHHHDHNHNHDHDHDRHRGHSREFHRSKPYLPDPFESSSTNNDDRPIREGYPVNPIKPTPLPDTATISAPDYRDKIDVRGSYATTPTRFPDRRQINYPSTTPTTKLTPRYDDKDEDCQFNCQNGKCVKEFEVCDGVNNCGNRLDEKNCDHLGYQVRLSNEEGKNNMGRVEVKILNKWGYVCDDKFGMRDADVVCRELGFPLGASEVRGNSYYPPRSDMMDENKDVLFVMDEIDCLGNETSLKECNFKGWGVHDCTPEEVVGVVCKVPVMKCPHDYWLCSTSKECIPPAFVCDNTEDCADKSDESESVCNSTIQYRLSGGDGRLEGRVEVKYRGKWGSVCDDDFTEVEAQVVCKSLGFYGKSTVIKNAFGPGTGPIWLDQVSCLGNETSIDKCVHWDWGDHNCNHTEDVSIRCSVGSITPKIENNNNYGNNNNNNKRSSNSGVKGRSSSSSPPPLSSLAPPRQLETADSDEIDNYMYQMERSSKMLNNKQEIKKCGYFNPNVKDEFEFPEERFQRVIQGTKARRGRYPWQATIRTRGRGGKSTHWCGAVLISKRHLLTAAHCLTGYQKEAYFVRLGDHYANIAESSEVDIFIDNWYIHEEFRKGGFHMNNDIALIVLKSPVHFNDYIQPICLPSKDASYEGGKLCTISGWGSIQSGISTPSNYLRAAQVPIIDESVCKRPIVYGKTITDGMFCAGYLDESTDACDGDSGGPLVCTENGVETLYGIISWGQHCGYPNKPGVYIKISHYIDWIYNKINFLYQSRRNSN